MITAVSTLLKTLLATGLIAALSPLLFTYNKRWIIWCNLLCILAFCAEVLSITYFYIYGGRVTWTMVKIGFIDISFSIEPLGLIFLTLISSLWLIAALYSFFYMRTVRDLAYSKILTFLGLAIYASTIIALARNLFVMFIGYETLTLVTIPLVAHYGMHHPSIVTYIRILIFSSIALFLPFIFIANIFAPNVQFALGGIFNDNMPLWVGHLLLFLSVFGIAKTALYPLGQWLPTAMIAPYPVSALLHAVAVVNAGLFCIFKIIIYIFGFDYVRELTIQYNWPLALALFTMLYASYKAVRHDSIKNILAYSTIAQLSLILCTSFLFTEKSMYSAILHMISHSFAKIVLFFAAGRFYAAIKCSRIEQLKGLAYKLPVPTIFFLIATLSLIGISPLAGSYSKHAILAEIMEHKYGYCISIAIGISTLCTTWYLGKILYNLFSPASEEIMIEAENQGSVFAGFHRTNSRAMDFAIALCCISIAAFPLIEKCLQSILWSIL